jgi:hypothetical protein
MGGGVSSALLSYLERNQGSATWLVAVSSAQSAAELILRSGGKPVIGMGGFTGSDPAMSLAKLKSYLASGKLRYVLLGGGGMDGPGGRANSAATSYVESTCTVVKPSAYGASFSASSTGVASAISTQTLYDCKR